jgi:hypothetical protein
MYLLLWIVFNEAQKAFHLGFNLILYFRQYFFASFIDGWLRSRTAEVLLHIRFTSLLRSNVVFHLLRERSIFLSSSMILFFNLHLQ